jgi:hypothetical protein
MRARVSVFIVLGVALVAVPLGFAIEPEPVVVFEPAPASFRSPTPVNVGSPKAAVAARFGMPSRIVSPELWVYHEFHTDHQAAAQRGFDTLAVVFTGDKVAHLRMVNGEMLTAALEAQRRAQQALLAQAPPRGR